MAPNRCALPPQARRAWAEAWARHLAPGGELVTLIFPVDPGADPDAGPPFPVTPELYESLLLAAGACGGRRPSMPSDLDCGWAGARRGAVMCSRNIAMGCVVERRAQTGSAAAGKPQSGPQPALSRRTLRASHCMRAPNTARCWCTAPLPWHPRLRAGQAGAGPERPQPPAARGTRVAGPLAASECCRSRARHSEQVLGPVIVSLSSWHILGPVVICWSEPCGAPLGCGHAFMEGRFPASLTSSRLRVCAGPHPPPPHLPPRSRRPPLCDRGCYSACVER
jgi:hypothetical protein